MKKNKTSIKTTQKTTTKAAKVAKATTKATKAAKVAKATTKATKAAKVAKATTKATKPAKVAKATAKHDGDGDSVGGIIHVMRSLLVAGPVTFSTLEKAAKKAGLSIRDRAAFALRGEEGFLSCYAKVLTRPGCKEAIRLPGKVVVEDGVARWMKRAA
jgi:methionyl-tRNA synthetase